MTLLKKKNEEQNGMGKKSWIRKCLTVDGFALSATLLVCSILMLFSFTSFLKTSSNVPQQAKEIVEERNLAHQEEHRPVKDIPQIHIKESEIIETTEVSVPETEVEIITSELSTEFIEETTEEYTIEPSTEKPSEPVFREVTRTIECEPSEICFIGDSRTCGMQVSVLSEVNFICKPSMGLQWLLEEAEPQFEEIKDNIKVCVVLLGINDVWNKYKYPKELNDFAKRYPDIHFAYVTIGPIDETKYSLLSNDDIENVNETIVQGLDDNWQIVDWYKYLATEGFATSDGGLHYTRSVCGVSFAWIVSQVQTYEYTEMVEVTDAIN